MPKPSTKTAIIMQVNPSSVTSEAYRSLRFNTDFDNKLKTISITSAGRGEGKTTTALNLAVAYARSGNKVMLLDADLRRPSIHYKFGGDNSRGLTNFLANQSSINEIIQESSIENLSTIMSGPVPANPSELLASKQMASLLDYLKLNYDMIVVDTPPILTINDAKIMAAKCDGVLLVVEYGKVKRNTAKKVKDELMLARANLLGVVLNKMK
jgi:capsular exopolysaccharide synthesis family protein